MLVWQWYLRGLGISVIKYGVWQLVKKSKNFPLAISCRYRHIPVDNLLGEQFCPTNGEISRVVVRISLLFRYG